MVRECVCVCSVRSEREGAARRPDVRGSASEFAPPEPAERPQSRFLRPQRSSASEFARLTELLRERVSEGASV
jgi:hypothetical protein